MVVRGRSPNIAMPMLAVIGSAPVEVGVFADRRGDPLRREPCLLHSRTARQGHRELIAAEPGEAVALPRAPAQGRGDFDDQLVARLAAVGVVDELEVIEVEHHQRAGVALAPRPRHRKPQILVEAPAVLQPGQRVLAGLAAQLLHPLVAAPDEHERAQEGGEAEAGDAEQQGEARPGTVGVADDQEPGLVGDLNGLRAASSSPPEGPATSRWEVRSCTSTASGTAETAAAAILEISKLPPTKPISGAALGHGPDRAPTR